MFVIAAGEAHATVATRVLAPRPPLDLLAFGLFLLIGGTVSCFANLYGLTFIEVIAEPARVEIYGLSPADYDSAAVTYQTTSVDPDTQVPLEANAFRRTGFSWDIRYQWIDTLHVHFAEGALNRVTGLSVSIGNETTRFTGGQVRTWRRIAPMPWTLLNTLHPDQSLEIPINKRAVLGVGRQILNWCSPARLVRETVRPAACFVVLVIVAALLFLRAIRHDRFERFAVRTLTRDITPSPVPSPRWFAFGLLIVIAGLLLFERMHAFAFTQDDNFNQFLPVILRSGETLLSGRMPTWNPYQLLGSPTTTVGTYMLTYPPTYVCWLLARYVFRNAYLTIEIFSIGHLLAGYLATYLALRRAGISPPISATGGFSFILSGWFLVAGASQATFVPLALFLPLLFDAAGRLSRGDVTWRWSVYTGALIGVFFHAGHAQMWTYSVLVFAVYVTVMAAGRRISWQRASWAVPALLFGLAIAAPLLLLQFQETRGISRIGGYGTGAVVSTMLLPLGKLARDPRLLSSVNPEYAPEMFHFGVILAGAAAAGLLLLALLTGTCRASGPLNPRRCIARNPWLPLVGLTVTLSLGDKGLIWTAMSLLPVFDKFRWPIKFAPFVALTAIFAGSLILERWIRPGNRNLRHWIAIVSGGLILFHVTLCRSTFYTMADHPYPQFPAEARRLMETPPATPQRFVAITPFRSPEPGYFQSLALNYATLAGLTAFGGYDTFVDTTPANRNAQQALRANGPLAAHAYAVRWLLVHDLALHPKYSPNPLLWASETPLVADQRALWSLRSQGQLAWHRGPLWLYQLPEPQPMAFRVSAPRVPLPVTPDQAGITIAAGGASPFDTITAAYLWRPWMRARVDGIVFPAFRDDSGRVSVQLAHAAHSVRFEYRPPWGASCLAGIAILLLGAAATVVCGRLPQPPA